MTDTDREAFEAWWESSGKALCGAQCFPRGGSVAEVYANRGFNAGYQAATQRQQSRIAELDDAARINRENYEFQRNKADKATATVYQFHYAMKDAGWHPGRTDDNLCDIIRAKGKALAELEAEVQALRKDAEWLPIETAPENTWILTFGDWQDPPVGISLYRNERRVIDRVEHESMNDKGRRRIVQEETVTNREWDGYHWEPTRWKPLPPAPGAAMNKEGDTD